LSVKVLSDVTKRKEYDTWGQTAEQMGRSGPSSGKDASGGRTQQQQQAWNFSSDVDPEELFRRIFGDAAFHGGNPFMSEDKDFSDSIYGYGAAEEVRTINEGTNMLTIDKS
jgi:DnaJ family protein A protein 3